MYRNITWFTLGYVAHKHLVPIAIEVIKKQNQRRQASRQNQQ